MFSRWNEMQSLDDVWMLDLGMGRGLRVGMDAGTDMDMSKAS
jgi:hypothetical protein